MKIIALETGLPDVSENAFTEELLRKEARKAWELYQSGIIREIYFRADKEAAVIILECKDANEAESIISSLPLVQQKLIKFEIIPLAPYPGFERLFK